MLALLSAFAAAAAILGAPAGAAASSCVYDAGTKTANAVIDPGGSAALRVSGSDLTFAGVVCLGATTSNTDTITVAGSAGTNEVLTLDQRGGLFGPGFTAETNVPEIEINTNLGDFDDTVVVYGTEGDDSISPGQLGLSLNVDGDSDVHFSPSAFHMEIHALGGVDYVNGFGQGGAGMHFLGPLVITGGDGNDVLLRGSTLDDVVTGGAGDDRIEGNDGVDSLDGGPGNDFITAAGGDDLVVGGTGNDNLSGGSENDIIRADDQEADSSINGGPGIDSAYYDNGLDPTPLATENRFPVDPPPPPPPPAGACAYDSASRAVSAQIPAGAAAVLKVVGGEIWFGAPTAAACGAATTANTDGITLTGGSGTLEQLTIDLSGGAFAPGFTAETTGSSEIEITTVLGEAGDAITILGSAGDDAISIGTSGAALNADGDVDLTFSPAPAEIEVRGLGGVNVLSGRGGSGAGQPFAGLVRLYAGDNGDTLRGSAGADLLVGGAGPDRLEGWEGNDRLEGAGGNDNLIGSDGDDEAIGGAGADFLNGGAGNDTLRADDDEADSGINGNQGIDTAYYDAGIDPTPLATENRIPA